MKILVNIKQALLHHGNRKCRFYMPNKQWGGVGESTSWWLKGEGVDDPGQTKQGGGVCVLVLGE